jgi:hypothetical protein
MSDKTGGPAFPTNGGVTYKGVTLLDYFAGEAMSSYPSSYPEGVHENVAEWCYDRAAAMLKEREKRK